MKRGNCTQCDKDIQVGESCYNDAFVDGGGYLCLVCGEKWWKEKIMRQDWGEFEEEE